MVSALIIPGAALPFVVIIATLFLPKLILTFLKYSSFLNLGK